MAIDYLLQENGGRIILDGHVGAGFLILETTPEGGAEGASGGSSKSSGTSLAQKQREQELRDLGERPVLKLGALAKGTILIQHKVFSKGRLQMLQKGRMESIVKPFRAAGTTLAKIMRSSYSESRGQIQKQSHNKIKTIIMNTEHLKDYEKILSGKIGSEMIQNVKLKKFSKLLAFNAIMEAKKKFTKRTRKPIQQGIFRVSDATPPRPVGRPDPDLPNPVLIFRTREDAKVDCLTCKPFNRRHYKLRDPNRPLLPIHPNCRCQWQNAKSKVMMGQF